MDDQRFDAVAKAFGSGHTRRRVLLGVLAGAMTGATGTFEAEAKRKRRTAKHAARHQERPDRKSQHQKRPVKASAKDCREEGHPCEGNQTCCSGLVCIVSGPGNAARCTPCPEGTVVYQGACCTPATCAELEKNCGSIDGGCGENLDCGRCTLPETCGGGGVPNVCGRPPCTPVTCTSPGTAFDLATCRCSFVAVASSECNTAAAGGICPAGSIRPVCCAPPPHVPAFTPCGPTENNGSGNVFPCQCWPRADGSGCFCGLFNGICNSDRPACPDGVCHEPGAACVSTGCAGARGPNRCALPCPA